MTIWVLPAILVVAFVGMWARDRRKKLPTIKVRQPEPELGDKDLNVLSSPVLYFIGKRMEGRRS